MYDVMSVYKCFEQIIISQSIHDILHKIDKCVLTLQLTM